MKTDFKTFLYYEWWKLLLAVILIGAIGISVVRCNSKTEADFGVLYISEDEVADPEVFRQTILNSGVVGDADGDGEMNVHICEIYIPESTEVMHQQRVPEQIQVELVSGECTLYILDEETLYENQAMDIFYDMSELAEKYGFGKDRIYTAQNGTACALSLAGNRALNSGGAPCDSLYLAIRNHDADDDGIKIKNAVAFAEYILKNQ